jgi:hypothetical protein
MVIGFRKALFGACFALAAGAPALAQENLDAGKSAAQLFNSECAICHKSPQGLSKSGGMFGLSGFLREHYTASRETAGMLAAYLKQVDAAAPAGKPAPPRRARASKPKSDEKKSDEKKADEKKPDEKKAEPKAADKAADTPKDEKPAAAQPAESKPAETPAERAETKPDAGHGANAKSDSSKPDNKPAASPSGGDKPDSAKTPADKPASAPSDKKE